MSILFTAKNEGVPSRKCSDVGVQILKDAVGKDAKIGMIKDCNFIDAQEADRYDDSIQAYIKSNPTENPRYRDFMLNFAEFARRSGGFYQETWQMEKGE